MFQKLRWKMTLSYTAVTVGALLIVELFLIVTAVLGTRAIVKTTFFQAFLVESLEADMAPLVRPYLDPFDEEGLQNAVDDLFRGSIGDGLVVQVEPAEEYVFVTDATGVVLASTREVPPADLETLRQPLKAALLGTQDYGQLMVVGEQQTFIVVPVKAESGELMGTLTLVDRTPQPTALFSPDLLGVVGMSLVAFTVLAGGVGTVFGFITARSLVQRLDRLATATEAWSVGDFTVFVRDHSSDEIGQLAQRLNRMAEQLENLLQSRKQLAILEERNRLARDLHDSAKQQAFAAAAQLAAAQAHLEVNPQQAGIHVAEADALITSLRGELTTLIEELRPVSLDDRGLAAAVDDFAQNWERRTGIALTTHITGERALALEHERALFRIMQEALANVARHSEAAQATLRLTYTPHAVTLTIVDNGQGFAPAVTTYGFGLHSMKERAERLPGGSFTLKSAPTGGTIVRVEMKGLTL